MIQSFRDIHLVFKNVHHSIRGSPQRQLLPMKDSPAMRLPRRSSTHASVMTTPRREQAAQMKNATSVPAQLTTGLKKADPTVAPSLPMAAQKPFSDVLTWAGKDSAGSMNVVLLGPKLLKK